MAEIVVAENKEGKFAFCYIPFAPFPSFSGCPGLACCLCFFPLYNSTLADPICRKVNSPPLGYVLRTTRGSCISKSVSQKHRVTTTPNAAA